ncbi:MAG: OB-fold nucleic acid binding domain-containing protein, partial [Candidatus Heimdallarchaeaceae archaeon]
MPESTYKHITDIETSDKDVKVRGWVYRIRKMKDKVFVVLRDATGILQCIGKLE